MKKRRESTRKRCIPSGTLPPESGIVDLYTYRIKKKLHAEGFRLRLDDSGKLTLLMRIGH